MKKRLVFVIMIIMLLLCACSGETESSTKDDVGKETNAAFESTDATTLEPSGTEQETEMVTVPLAPEDGNYTGPTFNASENVGDWEDSGNTGSTQPTGTGAATQPSTQPTTPSDTQTVSYEEYISWPTSKQQEYFLSFGDDIEGFYDWLEKAEAAYKEAHPEEGGDGNINIGDYMGNGG